MAATKTEQDNRRIQARLEKLLNRLPGLVYRCRLEPYASRETGQYRSILEYASAGSEHLLGISAASMIEQGLNVIERMTLDVDLERMRKTISDKIVAHEPWQIMYRLLLPDGSIKWVWDQGEAIYDEQGQPCFLEGIMLDVSDQKFQELALQEENRQLRLTLEHADCLGSLVGKSQAMHKVYALILKAAENDANVILYGETGCGKDVVARAIHNYSGRRGAYVPVNCGAIPENLLESEFFGYNKGAFTGATMAKEGFLAAADNGTLFLDEIGELPMNLQVKLLRVLESKTYTPLGSNTVKTSKFRLIAATNRDLAALVREGKARADFYYRINVLTITIPPLRERKEDLPLLVKAWSERNGLELKLSQKIRVAIARYDWPGNVRELNNFLDRYAAFGEDAADFLSNVEMFLPSLPEGESLEEATKQLERILIIRSLEKCHWHRGKTAQVLGLTLRTLQRKMKALAILDHERGE
ncbi:MAG: sigma 54-interacting transcriptional regulator [Desulfovibrio sp.]|nr:sigma 54-interacting transcriptional regulator [Desulfovibrio sp.]